MGCDASTEQQPNLIIHPKPQAHSGSIHKSAVE